MAPEIDAAITIIGIIGAAVSGFAFGHIRGEQSERRSQERIAASVAQREQADLIRAIARKVEA